MPYSLVFEFTNGKVNEIKPLCCDNPKSHYGFEDLSIERKAKKWAAELNKRFDDIKCRVKYYE